MNSKQSLSHTSWDCKCHVVWIPKCRREVMYGKIRARLGEMFQEQVSMENLTNYIVKV